MDGPVGLLLDGWLDGWLDVWISQKIASVANKEDCGNIENKSPFLTLSINT